MSQPPARRRAAPAPERTPHRRPTINDVARLAEVSKKTVSRVINQSPFVKPETRQRISQIIEEIGFIPDPQARGLAFRRAYLVGFVTDNPNPQYVVNMQLGLLDGLKGSPYELVVHPCNRTSPTFLADLRRFVERQKLMGVVLTPSVSEDERVKALLGEIGCAYVRVASVPLDEPQRMIVSNDRIGARLAGEHLAALGHKRIAFISGPTSFRSTPERRAGLAEALAKHGLTLDDALVVSGAYTFETGRDAALALLKLSPRPTAIFAANDEMAVGVLHAARSLGLDVPGDLSVVGFDDFQIAAQIWPPLTTIRTPTREIGRMAAALLISERETEPKHAQQTEPTLVARQSTGPAPR